MVAVYSLGPISGACLNPAVSLALGISKAMGGSGLDWIQVGLYTSVQCLDQNSLEGTPFYLSTQEIILF